MDLSDFRIDESFWTGSGEWVCVDKGKYFILAVKKKEWMTFNRYAPDVAIMVFEPVDFGGCDLTDRFMKN